MDTAVGARVAITVDRGPNAIAATTTTTARTPAPTSTTLRIAARLAPYRSSLLGVGQDLR